MTRLADGMLAREELQVVRLAPELKDVEEWMGWDVAAKIARFEDDEAFAALKPYDVSLFGYPELSKGLLLNSGGNYIWKRIRESSAAGGGNPDTTVLFSNANTNIGVGDSTTAAAVGQTDLQAATNKLRKAMDTSFPLIQGESAGGATATDRQFIVRSTFGSTDANFSWQEFIVVNASSSGTALDRFVSNQGTKVSGQVWQLTVTLTAS